MYQGNHVAELFLEQAHRFHSRLAIYDYDAETRYTYGEMLQRGHRLAYFLVQELGLCKGDRMGFCADNGVAFFDAFYASCLTGIIITTYNGMLLDNELRELVANEDPKVIFYSERFAAHIQALNDGGRTCICLNAEPDSRHLSYETIMARDVSPLPRIKAEEEDIQMLIHTGGTTGTPKAAMLSSRCILYNSISQILSLPLNGTDSAYVFLPLFHTAAWNVLSLPLLLSGGRIVLSGGFCAETALRIIQEERPTVGMAVETIYMAMAQHPNFYSTDFSCYRWMISGAAPIAKKTLEIYWARGVKLVNGYGMTEIGPSNLIPPVEYMSFQEIRQRWNSVGKPMYFNCVKILDARGKEVPQGEPGELVWKSKLVFSGYWNNSEPSRNILTPDGWVHSGDVGYCDADGYFYLCGRIKNMFISGGENIFPAEIEQIISTHPQVQECCVIGVPDKKWGECGKALVVLAPQSTLTEDGIRDLVRCNLASIKVPKYVAFVPDILKNSVGKRNLNAIYARYGKPCDGQNSMGRECAG